VVFNEYVRLLIQIPGEWRQYQRGQAAQFAQNTKLLREWALLRRIPRRGAPVKSPDEREGSRVAQLVAAAEARLKVGHELRRERKRAGGAASDNTAIRPDLTALGYNDDECVAILRSNSLHGAAVRLVARELDREPSSIRSSLRRARPAAAPSEPQEPQEPAE
jgi:hypothetical protein